MHPVSIETFDQIEAVGLAVVELRDTLKDLEPCYRFMTLAAVANELGEVYNMVQVAQLEFQAQGFRDLSDQWRTTTIELGRSLCHPQMRNRPMSPGTPSGKSRTRAAR